MGPLERLQREARKLGAGRPGAELARLRAGIHFLYVRNEPPRHRLALPGQPFDAWLLKLSPLFARSRRAFLEHGGEFRASLLSSPRSLSSAALLENRIEYSPCEAELVWAATDPIERKNPAHLGMIRSFTTSLFHEQNHRILWSVLPPAPRDPAALGRYLNLAESLIIASDMALGDELGPDLARIFYLGGATYDPGTPVRAEIGNRRQYRNYLQALVHATYLQLESFGTEGIGRALRALFPSLGAWADRANLRASRLDALFIYQTNQIWQRKHRAAVLRALASPARATRSEALVLPRDPLDHRQAYLIGETWFESLGL